MINYIVDRRKKSSTLFSVLAKMLLVVTFVALSGCQGKFHWPFSSSKDDNGVDSIPTEVTGASDKSRVKLQNKLNKSGAQVVTMGQDYLISIPSSQLFYYKSPRVKWGSYPLLNIVSDYLKQFRKISVTVTGFTNRTPNERRNLALSTARARSVANYLMSQAIDTRLVISEGLGSEKPMYQENTLNNSRIEITFRDVIV